MHYYRYYCSCEASLKSIAVFEIHKKCGVKLFSSFLFSYITCSYKRFFVGENEKKQSSDCLIIKSQQDLREKNVTKIPSYFYRFTFTYTKYDSLYFLQKMIVIHSRIETEGTVTVIDTI